MHALQHRIVAGKFVCDLIANNDELHVDFQFKGIKLHIIIS